jgi:hypothetical protein
MEMAGKEDPPRSKLSAKSRAHLLPAIELS